MPDAAADVQELERWLLEVSEPDWLWQVKYLSANDTYAKPNVHQGGPHVTKALLATAFPALTLRADHERNPDLSLPAFIDSHALSADLRLVWYNSRRLEQRLNGRDEARLTQWGGRDSPLVEPDATGSLTIFAFRLRSDTDADALRIWRCRSQAEEDLIVDRVGDVEPGRGRLISPGGREHGGEDAGVCALTDAQIPVDWRAAFPAGEQIVDWVVGKLPLRGKPIDDRLTARRDCEYALFRSVERFHALPRITEGFASVDAFIEYANTILNRRKSRSGRSLELHARTIFLEEDVAHTWAPHTEEKRTPDFIFPSIEAYHDMARPAESLRMLAAKTTCKDRWRQILNEAVRIDTKHLLTLQEGVSAAQHREMREHGVQLVVPRSLVPSYPEEVIPFLVSFEQFVAEVKEVCVP